MSLPPAASAEDVIDQPARAQFEVFLDEHRRELNRCRSRTEIGILREQITNE